jgi:hypothetical protein
MTMTLIETKTLGSSAAAIEFASIPQDATDLVVLASLRTDRATPNSDVIIQFNGVTSAIYSFRRLYGNGAGGGNSDSLTNDSKGGFVGNCSGNTATASVFGSNLIYIPNYAGSTAKSWSGDSVAETNATEALQVLVAGLSSATAAITSLAIKDYNDASFVAGSTISLYKITKGSDGIVTTS